LETRLKLSDRTCRQLADHLQLHKELFLTNWLKEAAADPAVPSDALTRLALLDHVPQMFDAMTHALRKHCSDEAMEQVQDIASRHTIIRWVQHYDLQGVLREVSFLRKEFIRHLDLFEQDSEASTSEARLFNALTVHGILDDIFMEATSTFLSLKTRSQA